ncbi:MAG: bifunctional proline dehydrogenase/L-glutamate gamma-semialdehyde dehydrogenase PutA, partial [Pseudomonadota bacterium]
MQQRLETIAADPLILSRPQDEAALVRRLIGDTDLDEGTRDRISELAADLVRHVREKTHPTMMESFLAEYGLSTEEGIGLMCLAEALLRVPDAATIDELISDKIEPGNWMAHLGASSSNLVNTATWALMLTGKVLDDDHPGVIGVLRGAVRRVGEPVVRTAVGQAMKILGQQFVLGETIEAGVANAKALEAKGYTYSYDMLGEAARTADDAERYFQSYSHAISVIGAEARDDIRSSPGISVKLSALHPRYEGRARDRALKELKPRLIHLCQQAAEAGIGLNIDAEEANRLELSLELAEMALAEPSLKDWHGFGVVVQAYSTRAPDVIDWLIRKATAHDRRVMVRLVKGAYWDTEIKHAQVLGVSAFPVFTRKAHTDVSYLACARKLMAATDRVYAQFATHNAHTVAAIQTMGGDADTFEFQRLHGMGEALHDAMMDRFGTRCRIYAPVGAHRDLLAYLVRRLLENGANSSFVNQIVNEDLPPEVIATDPIVEARAGGPSRNPHIRKPADLFRPERANAAGLDIDDPGDREPLLQARDAFGRTQWLAAPTGVSAESETIERPTRPILNPANDNDVVGHVADATVDDVRRAIETSRAAFASWSATPAAERAAALRKAAAAYERATA